MKKTFTVIETVMVGMILTVLLMGALAYNGAAGMFYRGIDRNVQVMNEMYLIVDHIHRTVSALAMGSGTDPGLTAVNIPGSLLMLVVRLPERAGGVHDPSLDNLDLNNIGQPSGAYIHHYGMPTQYAFEYMTGGVIDTLSERVMQFAFETHDSNPAVPANSVRITALVLRFDPAEPIEKDENPEVSLPAPITISSLAHSS